MADADTQQQNPSLNPILRVILEGLYDDQCILSTLRGCPNIVKEIWTEVTQFYKKQIVLPIAMEKDDSKRFTFRYSESNMRKFIKDSFVSESFLSAIYLYNQWFWPEHPNEYSFPPPSDININMMPFVVGDSLKNCKLPGTDYFF